MSNTFSWFRKNEKVAFAVLTLVAIIAFVAGDFFMSWTRQDRFEGGGSTTLVKFDGRNISIDEFRDLLGAHHAAYEFTNRVYQLGGENRTTAPRGFFPVQRATEQQFAQFLFFSDQAKRQGIDFSNDEITNYLRDLSNNASISEIARVRDEVIRDGRVVTEEKLYDAIRADLRRQQFINLAMSGFLSSQGQRSGAVVPGVEWENFKRIYRQVSVEALPIKVSDFEAEVKGEPTEKELAELYEKGKDYLAGNPYTPIAGMVVDRKLAFQFVKVDQSKIEKEEMAKISDEEVRKLYDQRVEKKDRSVTETVPVDQSSTDAKPEGEGVQPKSDDAEGEKEAEKPARDEATGDKPAEEPAKDAPSPDEKGAEEKPIEEPSSDSPATEEGKQSGVLKKAAEYFTGLQEEPAETEKAAEKQADEQQAEKAATEEAPAQEEPAADGDKPADQATEEKPAVKEGETTPPTEDDPTVQRPAKSPPKTETRIRPFEEVREELRKELAAPAVGAREEKIFKAIQDALDAFQKAHKKWEADVKKQGDISKVEKEPVVDDFLNPVVKDLMLDLEAYAPMDQFEIEDTDLGKIRWFDGQSLQRFSAFYRDVYRQVTAPYRCTRLDGEKPFRYIWWVTQDEAQKPLTQDEAKERLIAAWRKEQAFELAVAAAKDLSKKAAESFEKTTVKEEQDLAHAFAEKPASTGDIFKTKNFSWYDLGNLPFGSGGQITLSEVPEVPFAGEDFMKAVFALKLGEVGVAHDAGQNHVYVVRIASEGPPSDQLRQDFIDRSPDFFVGTISRNQAQRTFSEWLDEMVKRGKFDAMQLRRGGE